MDSNKNLNNIIQQRDWIKKKIRLTLLQFELIIINCELSSIQFIPIPMNINIENYYEISEEEEREKL